MKTLLQPRWLLICLLLLGGWLRVANLNWGDPFHFHPDERNVASAITRISWAENMDPEFFAYGSFPIYVVYFSVEWMHSGSNLILDHIVFGDAVETELPEALLFWAKGDRFAQAIMMGRLISAALSIALIWIMFEFGARFWGETVGLLASGIATFTVGFIQFAHFGTFEMWLSVERLLLLWVCLEIARTMKWYWVGLGGILFGLAVGTKITSLILGAGVALVFAYWIVHGRSTKVYHRIGEVVVKGWLFGFCAVCVFVITNPFALNADYFLRLAEGGPLSLSWKEWLNPAFVHSINVEGQIARGELDVFYTRQFTDTTPYVFQLIKVYPWILSWGMLLFALTGLLWLIWRGTVGRQFTAIMLVMWWFIQVGFLGSLYVKWTRYLVPTLPYMILAAAIFLVWIAHRSKQGRLVMLVTFFVLGWQILWTVGYSATYAHVDTRLELRDWALDNLPPNTAILSEVYDLGIIPMNQYFPNIELFNFYELDHPALGNQKRVELQDALEKSDVFIVLSRRLWANSLNHQEEYPRAAEFYDALFAGALGYEKVAEFSNYPNILGFTIDDETYAEETFSVFERPHIIVFKKIYE